MKISCKTGNNMEKLLDCIVDEAVILDSDDLINSTKNQSKISRKDIKASGKKKGPCC